MSKVPKEFNFYGLNVSELVLLGILVYIGALLIVIVVVRSVRFRAFCPFSGQCLHCSYVNCCTRCPSCSLKQSPKSVFCCKRRHTVYETRWFEDIPTVKVGCFKPDCSYLRCCCCEFYIKGVENGKEEEAPAVINLNNVEVDI